MSRNACHEGFRVTFSAQWLVSALARPAEVLELENTGSRTALGKKRCNVEGGSTPRPAPHQGEKNPSSRSVSR